MGFIDTVKKRASQFSYTYGSKDSSIDFYPPYFYQRLSKQIKAQGTQLSPEAVDNVVNIRSFKYISGLNLLHRMMHDMNSPDEIDMNPREKRYHDLQYADSLTWLTIKIADDIVDNQTRESGIIKPSEVKQFFNSIVFGEPKNTPEINATQEQKDALKAVAVCLREELDALNAKEAFKPVIDRLIETWEKESACKDMQDLREAKRDVYIASADTSLFFIMGAGDKKYRENYFPNEKQSEKIMRRMSTAAGYEDAFKDFHDDIANANNNIKPESGDRMWFLFAMVKEIANHLPELDNKQAAHVSAVSARQVIDVFKRIFSEKKAEERMEKYQKILGDAKNLFLDKSKGIEI